MRLTNRRSRRTNTHPSVPQRDRIARIAREKTERMLGTHDARAASARGGKGHSRFVRRGDTHEVTARRRSADATKVALKSSGNRVDRRRRGRQARPLCGTPLPRMFRERNTHAEYSSRTRAGTNGSGERGTYKLRYARQP